jgi:hypothetical protein
MTISKHICAHRGDAANLAPLLDDGTMVCTVKLEFSTYPARNRKTNTTEPDIQLSDSLKNTRWYIDVSVCRSEIQDAGGLDNAAGGVSNWMALAASLRCNWGLGRLREVLGRAEFQWPAEECTCFASYSPCLGRSGLEKWLPHFVSAVQGTTDIDAWPKARLADELQRRAAASSAPQQAENGQSDRNRMLRDQLLSELRVALQPSARLPALVVPAAGAAEFLIERPLYETLQRLGLLCDFDVDSGAAVPDGLSSALPGDKPSASYRSRRRITRSHGKEVVMLFEADRGKREYGWLYVGSHNLSGTAWGFPTSKGHGVMADIVQLSSWELGVVITRSRDAIADASTLCETFPFSAWPLQFDPRRLAPYSDDAAAAALLSFENPESSYSADAGMEIGDGFNGRACHTTLFQALNQALDQAQWIQLSDGEWVPIAACDESRRAENYTAADYAVNTQDALDHAVYEVDQYADMRASTQNCAHLYPMQPDELDAMRAGTQEMESLIGEVGRRDAVLPLSRGTLARVLHDQSPGELGDLSLRVGEIVVVVDGSNPSGWCVGERLCGGECGYFHRSLVEEAPATLQPQTKRQRAEQSCVGCRVKSASQMAHIGAGGCMCTQQDLESQNHLVDDDGERETTGPTAEAAVEVDADSDEVQEATVPTPLPAAPAESSISGDDLRVKLAGLARGTSATREGASRNTPLQVLERLVGGVRAFNDHARRPPVFTIDDCASPDRSQVSTALWRSGGQSAPAR